MITSEKVFKVVEVFDRALELKGGEAEVNMVESRVSESTLYESHYCGTVHCCAGWYYVGKHWDGGSRYLQEGSHQITYGMGNCEMAEDLGFENPYELRRWADKNPQIWGNRHGEYLFEDGEAYGWEDTHVGSLSAIRDHWMGVGMSLLAEEA